VIKWPVKLYVGYVLDVFFTFFFKIQKNMTFHVFWVVVHVFSNTGCQLYSSPLLCFLLRSVAESIQWRAIYLRIRSWCQVSKV